MSSGDLRAQAQAVLDELVAKGLNGAGLVGRDGLPLLLRFPRVQEETFSAMAAALLGAAEAALLELAESAPATAWLEAGKVRLAVVGLDDRTLLVAAAPSTFEAARFSTALDVARTRLKPLVGG